MIVIILIQNPGYLNQSVCYSVVASLMEVSYHVFETKLCLD